MRVAEQNRGGGERLSKTGEEEKGWKVGAGAQAAKGGRSRARMKIYFVCNVKIHVITTSCSM